MTKEYQTSGLSMKSMFVAAAMTLPICAAVLLGETLNHQYGVNAFMLLLILLCWLGTGFFLKYGSEYLDSGRSRVSLGELWLSSMMLLGVLCAGGAIVLTWLSAAWENGSYLWATGFALLGMMSGFFLNVWLKTETL